MMFSSNNLIQQKRYPVLILTITLHHLYPQLIFPRMLPKSRRKKSKALIIHPQRVGECQYEWTELEVKISTETGGGKGVFATQDLEVGTMIPIVGQLHQGTQPTDDENLTHCWEYRFKKPTQYINGHPDINPYKGVGSYGLAIVMMLNEKHVVVKCLFTICFIVFVFPNFSTLEL